MTDNRSDREIAAYARHLVKAHGGAVTAKKIRGSLRYYLQWREDGRQHSKYLKPREVDFVQREVAFGAGGVKLSRAAQSADDSFETGVLRGDDLLRMSRDVVGLRTRDAFPQLLSFVRESVGDRVMLLYGLRRTGKTTMLRQLILHLTPDELRRAAYVKINEGDELGALDRDLKKLRRMGVDIVLIDEVTLLSNFIDCASMFSDIHAALGMKIVFSGTDSLGFWFAAHEELYDREQMIHTTFIPFREHARLLGTDDIDTYIEYGGTLRIGDRRFDHADARNDRASFRSDESARFYVDTAIARNIQRSLQCFRRGGEFRHLQDLEDAGELTNVINRVVEDMNHRFVLRVIEEDFKSNDLGSASDLLMKSRDPARQMDVKSAVDVAGVTSALMRILDVLNRSQAKVAVTEDHLREIGRYFRVLDLVAEVEERFPDEQPRKRVLFTQPGLRYAQAQALVFALRSDSGFRSLAKERADALAACVLDDVRGRMLEDIVLYETLRARNRSTELSCGCDVFKLKFELGEIDMVVVDRASQTVALYEIKHSSERNPAQRRHLLDAAKIDWIGEHYGRLVSRTVLYRGESFETPEGVRYENVSTYLNSLKNFGRARHDSAQA